MQYNKLGVDSVKILSVCITQCAHTKQLEFSLLSPTSSFITVAFDSDCKADVILRPRSAKTIANLFFLNETYMNN